MVKIQAELQNHGTECQKGLNLMPPDLRTWGEYKTKLLLLGFFLENFQILFCFGQACEPCTFFRG